MTEEQSAAASDVRRGKVRDASLVGLMLVTVVVVLATALQSADSQQREEAATETASDLATKIDQVCSQGGSAAAKLGKYCQRAEEVVEQPETIVRTGMDGEDGEDGEDGKDGRDGRDGRPPTAKEIRTAVTSVFAEEPSIPEGEVESAVVDWLEAHPPEAGEDGQDGEDGADGQDGAPGRPPTTEEIAVAVAAYCSEGACKGDTGEQGTRGPAPTDEQIAAAVAAYCEGGSCQGKPGEQGPTGPPGPRGEQGPPGGLVCEEGYEKVTKQVWLRDERLDRPVWTEVVLCQEA